MNKIKMSMTTEEKKVIEELKNTLFDLDEKLREQLPLNQMRLINAKESAELGRSFVEGVEEGIRKSREEK